MVRRFDEVVNTVCRRYNIVCIDMAKETMWKDDDFYDFAHMTPKGVQKIGNYLFENLKVEILKTAKPLCSKALF
jgi:hypothetical protein